MKNIMPDPFPHMDTRKNSARITEANQERARLYAERKAKAQARAEQVRAHAIQERRECGNLGLAGRVLDDGRALGEHRRAHQVLGRSDAREFEDRARSVQQLRVRDDVTVRDLDVRAHRLEAP